MAKVARTQSTKLQSGKNTASSSVKASAEKAKKDAPLPKKAPAKKAVAPNAAAAKKAPTKVPKAVAEQRKVVSTVLITQPRPDTDKSPYFELARKYKLTLEFHPFIRVEGIAGKDFRKQRVDIGEYTAIVFTSRIAVDHFFRICEELKVKVSQDMKYVCITEAVALYLQKFILYRKRKVFFSADGSVKGMLDIITKHKLEKYLLPTSDTGREAFLQHFAKLTTPYAEVTMYRTVSNDIAAIMEKSFDMIVFFSPFSVHSLFTHDPQFAQNDTVIGAFGPSTTKAVEEVGLRLDVKAPAPNAPSMVSAMEQYLAGAK